jgi:hypothetical protein
MQISAYFEFRSKQDLFHLSAVFHILWSDGAKWNLTLGLFDLVVKCVNLCVIGTSLYTEE